MENYILANSSNYLLFVYQSKCQMDLIKRYRNKMMLLDATAAFHFLFFKANVGYQIVSSFVIENETLEPISEAVALVM